MMLNRSLTLLPIVLLAFQSVLVHGPVRDQPVSFGDSRCVLVNETMRCSPVILPSE